MGFCSYFLMGNFSYTGLLECWHNTYFQKVITFEPDKPQLSNRYQNEAYCMLFSAMYITKKSVHPHVTHFCRARHICYLYHAGSSKRKYLFVFFEIPSYSYGTLSPHGRLHGRLHRRFRTRSLLIMCIHCAVLRAPILPEDVIEYEDNHSQKENKAQEGKGQVVATRYILNETLDIVKQLNVC